MFDLGTICKLSTECRLGRGNPQFPEIFDLSRELEISRSNFYGFESTIYPLLKNLVSNLDY